MAKVILDGIWFFLSQILPVVVMLSSIATAIIPRVDKYGRHNSIHDYLDILALNVLNSSHDQKYIRKYACKSHPSE